MGEYNPNMIDNQARKELKYEWRATFSDGKVLNQYDDEKGIEINFREVINSLDKLDIFELISKTFPPIKVNLMTGLFWQGDILVPDSGEFIAGREIESGNIRGRAKLIYFRRYKRHYGAGMVTSGVEISYFLGWEARVDGEFRRYEIEAFEDGTVKIPIDDLKKDGFKPL